MLHTLPRSLAFALAGALLLPALAGCVTPPDLVGAASLEAPPMPERPRVVVAVIDTGINLYHSEYARGASEAATVVDATAESPTLPERVEAVEIPLSFVGDFDKALEADWDGLMAMEAETLYAFPGTKVVGAISFDAPSEDWPLVLDRPGFYTHGTMTTSRATGNTVSIAGADPDVHLVMIQGFGVEAIEWAQAQEWIDIVSISAGISPFGVAPVVPNALDTGETEAYQALAHTRPFFASSGNGWANGGLLGFPSWARGSSGAPDVISVGANDNDHISHWHNFDPYVSADGCNNPAADPGHAEDITMTGGGTSSATPFSAGGGAKLLLEARRLLNDTHVGPRVDDALAAPEGWDSLAVTDHQVVLAKGEAGLVASGPLADGVFTLLEFKDVLYHTALVTPTDDESDGVRCSPENYPDGSGSPFGGTYVPASAVPEAARFPFQGYGEINHASIEAAVAVLKGEAEPPTRAGEDAEYARAHAIKVRMMETV